MRTVIARKSLWPIKKFPPLKDGNATIIESSIIVEYLMPHYPGATRMIPVNDDATLQVRFMDRVFDNYVMTPMNTLVVDRMRAENERDAKGVADARKMLDVAYGWLKQVRRRRELFRAAGALGLMGFRVVGVEAMDLTELQRNPQWKLFDCRMLLQPAFEKDPELGTAGSILPNPE